MHIPVIEVGYLAQNGQTLTQRVRSKVACGKGGQLKKQRPSRRHA
jgi:hypothetical protein